MKSNKIDIEYLKQELVNRLITLNPEKIILFGSYVYGNPDENSDIDICVVNSGKSAKLEVKRAVRSLLKDLKIAKDILTPSKEEYDFYKNEFGSVYKEIEEKGKVLWTVS
jgi:predicted nucleotidyltransferase